MKAVEEIATEEKRARETAATAREKIAELEGERRQLAPAVVAGEKGAADRVAELEEEIAELERWAETSEIAADELRAQAEEAQIRAEEEEMRLREEEYDRLAGERYALLKKAESAMDELDAALKALRSHDAKQRAAWRALGNEDPSRPFSEILEARIGARLADHLPGFPKSGHPSTRQPLTETDAMRATIAQMRSEAETSTSRARERAAERERVRQAYELQQRIQFRRAQLLAQQGIDSDSSPRRREEAERRADELLRQEFPELREKEVEHG